MFYLQSWTQSEHFRPEVSVDTLSTGPGWGPFDLSHPSWVSIYNLVCLLLVSFTISVKTRCQHLVTT